MEEKRVKEKTGIFDVEYCGGLLRIGLPLPVWCKAMRAVEEGEIGAGVRHSAGYAYQAVQFWAFVSCFDWIRDFPVAEMTKMFVSSSKSYAYIVKVLEAAGLCVIDKERKVKNYKSKALGQTYEWYPRAVQNVLYSGASETTWFDYDLSGTYFRKMFDYYIESMDRESFKPERAQGRTVYPEGVYVSPYCELEYRYTGTTFRARMYEAYWVAVAVSRMGQDPVYNDRLYNGFHYVPRVMRKNLYFGGSRITELYDLHCSFYTLSAGLILEKYPDVDRDAVVRFYWDCVTGKLYDRCADYIKAPREVAKEKLQGWRNLYQKGTAHSPMFGYDRVSEFMENTYPVIADIYYGWETRVNEYGYTVKNLQRDLSEYETRKISKLAFELRDKYNVTCFTLHDAIYVSEKDKADKLPADIEKEILNWFETNIL